MPITEFAFLGFGGFTAKFKTQNRFKAYASNPPAKTILEVRDKFNHLAAEAPGKL